MPQLQRENRNRPRVLLISSERPWPRDSGVRQRLGATLDGLARVADVDLFSALPDPAPPPEAPVDLPVSRMTAVTGWADFRISRLPAWFASDRPRTVMLARWATPAHTLAQWQQGPYDVAWYLGCHVFLGLPHPPAHRYVLDVDDLPHQMLRHRLAQASARSDGPRTWVRVLADRVDERRWSRLLPGLLRRADIVIVCSDVDQDRIGGRAIVVPNGYDRPSTIARRRRRDDTPVLGFVGGMDYPPNADAAQFAAREVLPLVRSVRPTARLRLIGRVPPNSPVSGLGRLPGVEIRGHVEDISVELADVDVAVVPIRFGGGTRIKILEAFAHRVPVVSTTVGCEGLAVRHESTLLIADDAAGLAAACLRLLADKPLSASIVETAVAVQSRLYEWDATRDAVAGIVAELTGAVQ